MSTRTKIYLTLALMILVGGFLFVNGAFGRDQFRVDAGGKQSFFWVDSDGDYLSDASAGSTWAFPTGGDATDTLWLWLGTDGPDTTWNYESMPTANYKFGYRSSSSTIALPDSITIWGVSVADSSILGAGAFAASADDCIGDRLLDLGNGAGQINLMDLQDPSDVGHIIFSSAAHLWTSGAITKDASIDGAGKFTIVDDSHAHTNSTLTLAATDLTDTAALLYETELDAFSELQVQIADKTLINEEDAIILDVALTIDAPVFIKEQAEASADVVAYGQIWVNTADPNELWFTDDAGNDVQISSAAKGGIDYLVGTATLDLSSEIVVGTAPGGEMGGTWASPTIDSGIHDDEYILKTGGADWADSSRTGITKISADHDSGADMIWHVWKSGAASGDAVEVIWRATPYAGVQKTPPALRAWCENSNGRVDFTIKARTFSSYATDLAAGADSVFAYTLVTPAIPWDSAR